MFIRPERTLDSAVPSGRIPLGEAPDTLCLANFRLSLWDDICLDKTTSGGCPQRLAGGKDWQAIRRWGMQELKVFRLSKSSGPITSPKLK
jgi:hypothetical protein